MTDPASRQRRLDLDCAIADALFERSTVVAKLEGAETARRRGEALELLETSRPPTAVFDVASRRPIVLNAAWRTLFGTSDAYRVFAGVDDAGRSHAAIHVAELAVELDGRPAYCAATLRPSRGAPGTTPIVIVVCADVTDEVIARNLNVGTGVLVWGGPVAHGPDYFNRRWLDYAGDPLAAYAIHPADVTTYDQALATAARERRSTAVEARLRRADGAYRWHRVELAIAAAGARWFAAALDIHDARDALSERSDALAHEHIARTAAEETNRLKDQFLAVVSHELRGPLTALLVWERVLRDEVADPAMRERALDAIRESALSQARVVGDLLDVSRGISGKLYIDLRPVDLDPVLQGALDAIAPAALAKQITVARAGVSAAGEVQGDAGRLRQVIDNLLSNAVKFSDPGGRVTIAIEHRGRSIVIEVVDTGRGITAELLPRLFEPFFQAIDPLTRGGGGLGLGLSIASQLVELHHGALEASSAGPGRGATFTVTLPAANASAAPSRALGVASTPELVRTRVLVIDDDRRVRDALGLLLARTGAVVETAASAEAARARIGHDLPEVLLCDIAMPGEDGYSFIRRLRSTGSEIPAIALTACASEADVERAISAGFDRHVAKPIDFERLVATIGELTVDRRAGSRAP